MTKVLLELPLLSAKLPEFKTALENLPFLPPAQPAAKPSSKPSVKPSPAPSFTASEKPPDTQAEPYSNSALNPQLYRASELYDPGRADLRALDLDLGSFPNPQFATEDLLPGLRKLGLRQTASPNHLLSLAERTATLAETGAFEEAEKRAKALLSYLGTPEVERALGQNPGFWRRLRAVPWLPVTQKARGVEGVVSFLRESFAPPEEVFLPKHRKLVCAVRFVLGGNLQAPSEKVATWLKMRHEPDVRTVIENLICSVECLEKEGAPRFSEAWSFFEATYKFLDREASESDLAGLESVRWILSESGSGERGKEVTFQESEQVYQVPLDGDRNLDLRPYLYELHPYISRFSSLLRKCHVAEKCTAKNVVTALRQLQIDVGARKLLRREETLLLDALTALRRQRSGEEVLRSGSGLLLPDAQGYLRTPETLLYIDTEWMEGIPRECAGYTEVSKDLSVGLAAACGVKSVHQVLQETHGAGLGEEFGQEERLTDRIWTILKDYPGDEAVLKELVQNADDAGGCADSVCRFWSLGRCLVASALRVGSGSILWLRISIFPLLRVFACGLCLRLL